MKCFHCLKFFSGYSDVSGVFYFLTSSHLNG